jgi:hypothetical protein
VILESLATPEIQVFQDILDSQEPQGTQDLVELAAILVILVFPDIAGILVFPVTQATPVSQGTLVSQEYLAIQDSLVLVDTPVFPVSQDSLVTAVSAGTLE